MKALPAIRSSIEGLGSARAEVLTRSLRPFDTAEFSRWGETVSTEILPLEAANRQPSEQFSGKAMIARFQDTVAAEIRSSAHRVMRTRQLVSRDERRYFKVLWQLAGKNQLGQGKGAATIHAGEWAIYDTSRPYTVETSDHAHFILLLLPLEELGAWSLGIEQFTGKALPTVGTSLIARAAVSSVLTGEVSLDSDGERVLQESVSALMGNAIHKLSAASGIQQTQANRRLQMAKDFIDQHLTDPDLSPEQVAKVCGMSKRSLYTAFQALAQTPHGYMMARRISRACEMLADPQSRRTMTQVAYELGFADAAHFSRLFSERQGVSPTQWRARHVTSV